MKLGRSQNAVYELLKKSKPTSAQEAGDALYEKTSDCFPEFGYGGMGGKSTPEMVRRMWASKALNNLAKKNLIAFKKEGNEKKWFVKREEKCPNS
jgi:hypothetical protein